MAFGVTPLSTTTLGANQFPINAVASPDTPSGNLTAVAGARGAFVDANGNPITAVSMALMTPAIVQSAHAVTGAAGKTLNIAFTSNNIKGNSIVVVVGIGEVQSGANITLAVTDSNGNTYTQAAFASQSTTLEASIFYAVNVASGANTVTVTIAGASSTNTAIAAEIYEVYGIITYVQGALDVSATNNNAGSTSVSTGNVTPLAPNELAFVGIAAAGGTITAGTNWTLDSTSLSPTGGNLGSFGSESQSLATTAAINGTATLSASNAWAVVIATFKPFLLPIPGTVNQGGAPWQENITQFGSNPLQTGVGTSGVGVPRITVSNDSELQLWDGTRGPVAVKAANTPPALADPALVAALSPNNTGLPVNTPAIVQKTNNVSSGSVASLAKAFTSNNTQGNSIVVVCAIGNGTAPTISDSAGNIYTQAAQIANSTVFNVAIFYSVGPTSGGGISGGANTVTVSNGGAAASIAMEIYELSGLITLVPAQPDATATNTGSSGTASTPAISAASPNEYAFAGIGVGTAAQTITTGAGWTNDSGQQNPTTPSGLFSFVSMSQFLGSIKAVTPQATFSSEPWSLAVATFRPVIVGIEGSVNIAQINGAPPNNTNPLPVQWVSQSGYVAPSSPPTTTTASADTPFTFTSQVDVVILQNNTSAVVNYAFDTAASAGSLLLQPGQTLVYAKKVTVVHLFTAAAQNINGTTAGNIVVLGEL